jgi:hypothetical protein
MKKILISVILMMAFISIACQSATVIEKTRVVEQGPDLEQITNSTLLIVVENIQKTDVTLAYDLATLVEYQGEKYLVTHNHWNEMLQDMNIIELRDADYTMIRTIYAKDFKSLIVFLDAGTMILRAPAGLPDSLTPGSFEAAAQLNAGDTVLVARWSHPNRDQLEVTQAVIEESSFLKGEPVYTLRNLNGQPLHPGDSGGGVWHNGKLVANTWTVVTNYSSVDSAGTVDPTSETLTDISHAAKFPVEFK